MESAADEETRMKFVVFTLGCRVNIYEGQSMISAIKAHGHEATDRLEWADCYIINTCSVTAEADKKSRQAVARVLRLNPQARVIICGCSSQNDKKQYENKPNVTIIGGTSGKMRLIESIMSDIVPSMSAPPREYEDDLLPERTLTRAYIKVQDGCDRFCSYCIIPYLRGRSRSRPLASIVREAEESAEKAGELVITGIDVSDYGKGLGLTLHDLVKALGKIPVRKRFGSLECTAIDRRLVELMAEGGWCDSVHLSMQSGSDSVLKRMNRRYTAEEYLSRLEIIRGVFPDAGITTDVIAGFPGESEREFDETVDVCRRAAFSGMHVFPYSRREGTAAARLAPLPAATVSERAARLGEVDKTLRQNFLLAQSGKTAEVYAEEEKYGFVTGFTTNYVKVYAEAKSPVPAGTFIKVKLSRPYRDGIKGEIL